jgi:CheY-like chemotaxis protein
MNRVLVVDDEEIPLRATAALLRLAGFVVETALGGESALELLAHHEFDGAVVDLMMPRMNGLELTRKLHALQPRMRIVLTSSFPLSPRQLERMGLGGQVTFLPKPSSRADLEAALRTEPAPAPNHGHSASATPAATPPHSPHARRH